jgi:hypothetical protein
LISRGEESVELLWIRESVCHKKPIRERDS